MKGIIFNITEDFITEKFGEEILMDIINSERIQTKEPFVGPGTYPFSDMQEIVKLIQELKGIEPADFLREVGEYAYPKLAERVPDLVKAHSSARSLLLSIDQIIHVEVRKLYQHSKLPVFQYREPSERELVITYFSEKKLYTFMEGLINGTAKSFSENIRQEMTVYEKEGREYCDFHLYFYE
jgi:hypothetical protein